MAKKLQKKNPGIPVGTTLTRGDAVQLDCGCCTRWPILVDGKEVAYAEQVCETRTHRALIGGKTEVLGGTIESVLKKVWRVVVNGETLA